MSYYNNRLLRIEKDRRRLKQESMTLGFCMGAAVGFLLAVLLKAATNFH